MGERCREQNGAGKGGRECDRARESMENQERTGRKYTNTHVQYTYWVEQSHPVKQMCHVTLLDHLTHIA